MDALEHSLKKNKRSNRNLTGPKAVTFMCRHFKVLSKNVDHILEESNETPYSIIQKVVFFCLSLSLLHQVTKIEIIKTV